MTKSQAVAMALLVDLVLALVPHPPLMAIMAPAADGALGGRLVVEEEYRDGDGENGVGSLIPTVTAGSLRKKRASWTTIEGPLKTLKKIPPE
jgi:hypothetical protein